MATWGVPLQRPDFKKTFLWDSEVLGESVREDLIIFCWCMPTTNYRLSTVGVNFLSTHDSWKCCLEPPFSLPLVLLWGIFWQKWYFVETYLLVKTLQDFYKHFLYIKVWLMKSQTGGRNQFRKNKSNKRRKDSIFNHSWFISDHLVTEVNVHLLKSVID